jgi:hypothetical protein
MATEHDFRGQAVLAAEELAAGHPRLVCSRESGRRHVRWPRARIGTWTTRLVVARQTAASPGRCESRCSSNLVSRSSTTASRGKASSRGRGIPCLPTVARMTGSQRRAHTAPRVEYGSSSQELPRARRCKLKSRRPPTRRGTHATPRLRSPTRIFLDLCCDRHLARRPADTPLRHLLYKVVVQRCVSANGHDSGQQKTPRFAGLS